MMKHNKRMNLQNDGFSATSEFQSGGFTIFKTDYLDMKPIFEYIRSGNFSVPFDIIANKKVNFSAKNESGDTILHLLLKQYNNFKNDERFFRLLNIVISKVDSNSVNIQNNDGDTPLHIAVKNNLHDIASILIAKKNANPSIRNNEDLYIKTATPQEMERHLETISLSIPASEMLTSAKPIIRKIEEKINTLDPNLSISALAKNVGSYVESAKGYVSNLLKPSELQSISLSMDKMPETTEEPIKNTANIPIASTGFEEPVELSATSPEGVKQGDINASKPAELKGGQNVDLMDTDQFVSTLLSQYSKKKVGGGSRKSIIGQRKLNKTPVSSEFSGGKSSVSYSEIKKHKKDKTSSDKSISEIGRLIKSQSDLIHERVVKSIMEIMNVDEQTAKYYKAGLWNKVKEEFPTGSKLDKALEMEKMARKEILDTIPIAELSEKIQEHYKQKEKEREKHRSEKSSESSTDSSFSVDSSSESEGKKKRKPASKKVKKSKKSEFSDTSINSIPFNEKNSSTSDD